MFKNYLKLAIKVLMRRKMFTFINLFGISFTLMILLAATALFTSMIVYNPVETKLSRSLYLNEIPVQLNKDSWNIGPTDGYVIENTIKKLKNIETYSFFSNGIQSQTTYLNNHRIDIDTKRTDENFFKIFTLKFLEGQPYSKADIESGKKVCVINKSLSLRYFGDTKTVGKKITFNNNIYMICGVVQDVPSLYKNVYADLWRPYDYAGYMNTVKNKNLYNNEFKAVVIAYNKSDYEDIQSQLTKNLEKIKPKDVYKIPGRLKTPFQTNFGMFDDDNPFSNKGDKIKNIGIAVFMISLFLLLPLLNLTSLTVSRIFERSSEIGVRKSFGATKHMMIWQFVYENIIVCLLGGFIGFGGAWLLLKGINASGLMQIGSVSFSYQVLIYGFLIILIFGFLSGFYPALKMSKLQITEALKGGKQ